MSVLTHKDTELESNSVRNDLTTAFYWLIFAVSCFATRAAFFGWFMTPSLANLLQINQSSVIGGPSDNSIALEDLGLLTMAIAACAISVRYAVGYWKSTK